ncbi:hypothetical protein [Streptosporangium sp. NPDC000396]|uniref:hypothetical protein n=1 Tax=Streptosporangium sp. NPDC000396 TaxID=3366185 RepID=UPI003680B4F8
MSKRYYIVAASVLCLTLATACGSSGSVIGGLIKVASTPTGEPSQPTAPADDFKRVGSEANGLTVAVPREWVALDLTKDDLDEGLRRSGLSGEAMKRAKESLQILAANNAIWAFDPESMKTSPHRFTTNLNAYCQSGASSSIEQLIGSASKELEQLGAKVSEAAPVRIAGSEAARIVYTLPAGNLTVKGTQFYVPTSDTTCTVTLSTDKDDRQQLFDQIGETIRPL